MPSPKAGSTADLPPEQEIAAAEESREADIDAMFGMNADEEVAAGEGEATAPDAAAGAAGAAPEDGPAPAPALPVPGETPPSPSGDVAATPPAAKPGEVSTPPSGQQPAQTGQPPAPGAPPAPAAPVDPNLLRVNSLEATVAALQAELAASRASPAQAGQSPQAQTSGQQDDLPRYALTLPPQVAAALTSGEDQQTVAGVTHMMNSLATIVHHNVRLEMRQALGQLLQTAQAQQSEQETSKFIQDSRADYYGAFPAHNNPLILPIIQAESVAMSGEFPGLPWNENYRNALGQRVEARLAQLRGQQQPQGQAPPAAPAAMLPVGSRQEVPGSELTGGDLIADTFS